MYELIQLAGQSFYIQSPAKIGLVKLNDTDVVLIDSGNDKDAGRKVRQILDAHGLKLKAIYNTHSNADHIGVNAYLQYIVRGLIIVLAVAIDVRKYLVKK